MDVLLGAVERLEGQGGLRRRRGVLLEALVAVLVDLECRGVVA